MPFSLYRPISLHVFARTCLIVALLPIASAQDITQTCGPVRFEGQTGPFDYRYERGSILRDVESNHFPPRVEALIRGVSASVPIGAELDYTLVRFPNHHRALVSMIRLGEKTGSQRPSGTQWSVECYILRAQRYATDDPLVRMIYAQFLGLRKRYPEALAQLEQAKSDARDSPFTQHNIGLVYLELGEHELALGQAWNAAAMGFPRQDLKQALQQAGKWREPPP